MARTEGILYELAFFSDIASFYMSTDSSLLSRRDRLLLSFASMLWSKSYYVGGHSRMNFRNLERYRLVSRATCIGSRVSRGCSGAPTRAPASR
jgi:hypothetical protein